MYLLVTGCSESYESRYASYGEAEQRGAIKNGWIPENIPKTAVDIVKKHNVERRSTIISFAYTGRFRDMLGDDCELADKKNLIWPNISAKWWPQDLNVDYKETIDLPYVFYWCNNLEGFYAISTLTNRAYFWQ